MTSLSLSNDASMSEVSRPILRLLTPSAASSVVEPTPSQASATIGAPAIEYQTTLTQLSPASTSYTEPTGNQKIIIGTLATATILILIALGGVLLQWQIARRRKTLQPKRLRYKASFEDPFAPGTPGTSHEHSAGSDEAAAMTADYCKPKLDRFPGAFAVKAADGEWLKVDWQASESALMKTKVNAMKTDQHQRRSHDHDSRPLHNARDIRNNNGSPKNTKNNEYKQDYHNGHGSANDHQVKLGTGNEGGPLTSHPVTPHFSLPIRPKPSHDRKHEEQSKLEPNNLHHFSKSRIQNTEFQLRTPSIYNEDIDRQQIYGSMPAMGSGSLTSPSGSESEAETETEEIATMSPNSPNHRKSPAPRGILKKSPSPTNSGQADAVEAEKGEGADYGFPAPPTSPSRRSALKSAKSAVKRVLSPGKKGDSTAEGSRSDQQPSPEGTSRRNEHNDAPVRPRPPRKSVSFGEVQVRRVVQRMEEEDGGWETVDSDGSGEGDTQGKGVRK